MSYEKMRVLDLLDSGKITADEAARLLEALGKNTGFISKETRENMEDKLQRFAKDCGKLAKEVGGKVQVLYKGVEPKLKKVGQSALEKAACALEDLACTISESLEKVAQDCCEDEECCCPEVECCPEEECCPEAECCPEEKAAECCPEEKCEEECEEKEEPSTQSWQY